MNKKVKELEKRVRELNEEKRLLVNQVSDLTPKKKKVLSPYIHGKIHSSLEHPISLLETEKAKMFDFAGRWVGSPGNAGEIRLNQLAGITKAISILNVEKIKEIKEYSTQELRKLANLKEPRTGPAGA